MVVNFRLVCGLLTFVLWLATFGLWLAYVWVVVDSHLVAVGLQLGCGWIGPGRWLGPNPTLGCNWN